MPRVRSRQRPSIAGSDRYSDHIRLAVVPSLNDVVRQYTELSEADLDWLHALVADWQLDHDEAVRGITWVMGLIEQAVAEGQRPPRP